MTVPFGDKYVTNISSYKLITKFFYTFFKAQVTHMGSNNT